MLWSDNETAWSIFTPQRWGHQRSDAVKEAQQREKGRDDSRVSSVPSPHAPLDTVVHLLAVEMGKQQITESQNGRGWEGPLWVIQSKPPAGAGSPTAGCTGPCPGGSWISPDQTSFVPSPLEILAKTSTSHQERRQAARQRSEGAEVPELDVSADAARGCSQPLHLKIIKWAFLFQNPRPSWSPVLLPSVNWTLRNKSAWSRAGTERYWNISQFWAQSFFTLVLPSRMEEFLVQTLLPGPRYIFGSYVYPFFFSPQLTLFLPWTSRKLGVFLFFSHLLKTETHCSVAWWKRAAGSAPDTDAILI